MATRAQIAATVDYMFAFAATTGAVRGRILAPDGAPLSGINVIARNLADDRDAISYLSGTTVVPPGAYTLKLPQGVYRIEFSGH